MTGIVGVMSSAKCDGRTNASTPRLLARLRISSESDETTIRSKKREPWIFEIGWAIIGTPRNGLMFFRGILLLPPLAGMMAIFFMNIF